MTSNTNTKSSSVYSAGQFMNPGPAPRPPIDRLRSNLSYHSPTTSVSSNATTLVPPSSAFSASSLSLVSQKGSEKSGGAYKVVKDGWVKVKDTEGFKSFVWSDRFLVLRDFQLDFLKNNNTPKVAYSIQLQDITRITRSDSHPYSFEISRNTHSGHGSPPSREPNVKMLIVKVEKDEEVYSWMDSIYQRCPSMGGVSNPTDFSHHVHVGFDPTNGAFVGLPPEWEKLLTASAITKDDYEKNPKAVLEVLEFYTEKLQKREDDPATYPSLTPTPSVQPNEHKQLGYSTGGNSVALPRPPPPTNFQRADSYTGRRSESPSSSSLYGQQDRNITSMPYRPMAPVDPRLEEERRRRAEDDARRQREREMQQREQGRTEREEQAVYNASLPKKKTPLAKQELGGYTAEPNDDITPSSSSRYDPSRPPPSAPNTGRDKQQPPSPYRQPSSQPRAAPAVPTASNLASAAKQGPGARQLQPNGQRQPSPSPSRPAYSEAQPQSGARAATGGTNGQAQTKASGSTSAHPKPLNIAKSTPTAQKSDAVKQAEEALTKKDDNPPRKEVRMSSMTESEVMAKLREVVAKDRPLDSYNKQKKIGQGASGSVYVARIRENPPSPTARQLLRENGPRTQVAIKQMDLRNQPRKELIVNEIIVMKDSKHPNIVNFLDAFLQEDQSELWVVMEFMEGGALTDVIDNNSAISEDQIATICVEVSLELSQIILCGMLRAC